MNALMSNAAWNEAAQQLATATKEIEAKGMPLLLLLPACLSGRVPTNGIFCREPRSSLDQLKGKRSVATGIVQSDELKALGLIPVSLNHN